MNADLIIHVPYGVVVIDDIVAVHRMKGPGEKPMAEIYLRNGTKLEYAYGSTESRDAAVVRIASSIAVRLQERRAIERDAFKYLRAKK